MYANWKDEVRAFDHDIMQKRRLASRTFGFVRHKVYRSKAVIESAEDSCCQYAPEEDRLDKDFDGSLKRDHDRRINKGKELRALRAGRHLYRQQKLFNDRDKEWEVTQEHEYNLLTKKNLPNKSGEAYNVINMEYDDSYEGQKLKYKDDAKRWRDGMRRLRLHNKLSGNRNFNVITWEKTRQMEVPPRPQFEMRESPRPYIMQRPESCMAPRIAPEAARPVTIITSRSDASQNCPWELERYLFKPYAFK